MTIEELKAEREEREEQIDELAELLLLEMKRSIRLLENKAYNNRFGSRVNGWAELNSKLHEIRRDSITLNRIIKEY